MRDLHNHLKHVVVTAPISGAADNTASTGTGVDRLGFESLELVITLGVIADADATFAVEVQESDASGSGYTAVADADLIGTEAQAAFAFDSDGGVRKIGYKGTKRYVRTVITPSNNAGAWLHAVTAVLGNARRSPSQTGDGAAVTQTP
jgi:hypothetical protein